MIAERTGIGRRGEVAGEESYPNRNPATQLPSPRSLSENPDSLERTDALRV